MQPTIRSTKPLGSTEDGEMKRIAVAQDAFERRDVEASRAEHMRGTNLAHVENHASEASDYVKCVVFGGLDGIMTTFAIIAAAAGSSTIFKTIIVFGFSNVVADAFAMGFGEYVSGVAELDHARAERAREEWEVENSKDLEVEEMVEIFQNRGVAEDDARIMVNILAKDSQLFVDFMMVNELGILADTNDTSQPMKQGLVMFCSFILFGSIPLLAYLFAWGGQGLDRVFATSCLMTAIGLMCLGAVKGFLTRMNIPRAAVLMLLNGCVSGGVSFGISSMVESMVE